MVFKSRAFENELEIKEMNAPTDKGKWHSKFVGYFAGYNNVHV
jgi:hypothetical protein